MMQNSLVGELYSFGVGTSFEVRNEDFTYVLFAAFKSADAAKELSEEQPANF